MSAIDLIGLEKRFDSFAALSDVTMTIAPGEFVTILGPSGCGKTTLLKLISGFLEPTQGRIRIGGQDVTRVPPEARETALCFQSYALFPHLNVRENLDFGLRQKRVSAAERQARVADVAAKLDLGPQMAKLPNQLSGGQQQRVSLGRALAMRPNVILFDEPLSNLDARLRDQVRFEIRRIQQDYGLTAIYVTHDQSEALAMSDRVIVLNRGRVEQIDTPEQLYHRPRTRFVADFVGAANVLSAVVQGEATDGGWQVETEAGPLHVRSDTPPAGRQIPVAWRPEHASLAHPPPPPARGGEHNRNIHPARVLHRAFQGPFTDLVLEMGDSQVRVQVGETEARAGDTVSVHIPAGCVRFLEPDR